MAPVDRSLSTSEGFWSAFCATFGLPAMCPSSDSDHSETSVEVLIDLVLAEAPGGRDPIILVLDHWDLALDDSLDRIDQLAQDQLRGHLLKRHTANRSGQRAARIVALVGSPCPDAFADWARDREARAVGPKALSKTLERRFVSARFPLMRASSAARILCAHGFSDGEATLLARFCGGWLGLLATAAEARRQRSDVEAAVVRAAGQLLEKATWPYARKRLPSRDEPDGVWRARVLDDILRSDTANLTLESYGLPYEKVVDRHNSGRTRYRLVRAVDETIPRPKFMLVDLENCRFRIAGPTQRRARILDAVARLYEVHADRVLLFTKSDRSLALAIGPVTRPWSVFKSQLTETSKSLKGESGGKDNSDDVVLAGHFGRITAEFPFATLIILSGDKDYWGAVSRHVGPGHRVFQVVPPDADSLFLRKNAIGWVVDQQTITRAENEVDGASR